MIKNFNNTTSIVRLNSSILKKGKFIYTQTSQTEYTVFTKGDKIKIELKGFWYLLTQKINSAIIVAWFEKLPIGAKFKLTDAKGEIIDIFAVGTENTSSMKLSSSANYITLDITKYIAVSNPITNNPLYLTLPTEDTVNFIGYSLIDNENAKKELAQKILYFQINYTNIEGFEEHFSYLQQNVGQADIGKVNLYNGDLLFAHSLSHLISTLSSFTFGLYYNALFSEEEKTIGKGWRTNFDYDVDLSTISQDHIIKLTDYTHKKMNFQLLGEDQLSNLMLNKKDIIYYCYAESSYIKDNKDNTYTYVTSKNERLHFKLESDKMQIIEMIDPKGYKLTFEYENTNILRVTSFDGNTIDLMYESGRLTQVKSKNEDYYAQLSYNLDRLTNITLKRDVLDAEQPNIHTPRVDIIRDVQIGYSDNRLTSITNLTDKIGCLYNYQNGKVIQTQKFVLDSRGQRKYGSKFQIQYTDDYTKVKDMSGNEKIYFFDAYGSCLYNIDDQNKSTNFKYGTINQYDEKRECHKLLSKTEVQTNLRNLICNHSFEFENDVLDGWTIQKPSTTSIEPSENGVYGERCLKITNTNLSETFTMSQSVKLPAKGTYRTFGYYKTDIQSSRLMKVIALVRYQEKKLITTTTYSGREKQEEVSVEVKKEFTKDLLPTNGRWEKFDLETLPVPEGASIDLSFKLSFNGTFYFDEIQCTRNNFKARHNFVKNSHFEESQGNLPKFWVGENLTADDQLVPATPTFDSQKELFGTMSFKFQGSDELQEKSLSQTISLKGDAGENLVINSWLKSLLTMNETLAVIVGIHYQNLKQDQFKEYRFNATKNLSSWQVLTNSIVTEFPYDKVKVTIYYKGFRETIIDAIQLYKSNVGSVFSYDKKGNLISASEDETKQEGVFDKNNRMKSKTCADGTAYKYSYDTTGTLIGVEDNFGNHVALNYSDDRKKLIKEVYGDNQFICSSEETNKTGDRIVVDELGNKSLLHYDGNGNVVYSEKDDGVSVRNEYDSKSRILEIERSKDMQSIGTCLFDYDAIGQLSKIQCANNTIFNFTYDEWGRCAEASIKNDRLVERTFSDRSIVDQDLVYTEKVKGNEIVTKQFVYDKYGHPIEILIDNITRFHLVYDDLGRLVEIMDLTENISHFFNYDFNNHLISETDNQGRTIQYDYDNLGNKQKEIVRFENNVYAFDFSYDYEMNEFNRDSFFGRLDRTYQDDMVIGDNGTDGIYGLRARHHNYRFTYDEEIRLNTVELGFAKQCLEYDLSSANSSRQNTMSHGGTFNKFLWNLNFQKSKTVYGWFKVLGTISNKTLLRFCGKDIDIQLIMNNPNKLTLKANSSSATINLPPSILNEWIMPALVVFNDQTKTKVFLYLNGRFMRMISIDTALCDKITTLYVGDEQLGDANAVAYVTASKTPIRVAFLAVGAYHYKNINLQSIYDQSKAFMFDATKLAKRSGVSYTILSSEEYDYVLLNGSLVFKSGIKPVYYSYSDGSYKIDKTKIFTFDKELNRHVYGSYSGTLQLKDGNDSRLTYDLHLNKELTLQMEIKPVYDSNSEENRTIFAISDHAYQEKVNVYLDSIDTLCCAINGQIYETDAKIGKECYQSLAVRLNESSMTLSLNGVDIATFSSTNITDCLLHIGCSVKMENNREIASKHFNGNINELLYCHKKLLNEELLALNTSKKNNFYTTEYDTFGRRKQDTISLAGHSYTRNYEYIQPKDAAGVPIPSRTSMSIGKTMDSFGKVTSFEYDCNGNIQKVLTEQNGTLSEEHYVYDGFDRLVKSVRKGITTKYAYDANGNILSKSIEEENGDITLYDFIYHEDNKEKLTGFTISTTNGVTQTSNCTYTPNSFYPISIGDKELKWKGENLVEVTTPTESILFTYDCKNRRIKKTVGNKTTKYVYDQQRLIAEINPDSKTIYVYDEKGDIDGFIHTTGNVSKSYGYIKDITGVITDIIDENGAIVCSYTYDDFGTCISMNGDPIIQNINHILYKGYYYDSELNWYILGQRYYDSMLCRFISPDKIENIQKAFTDQLQFNLFAYCDNNPIMRADANGQSWFKSLIKGIVSAVVAVVTGVVGIAAGIVLGTINAIAAVVQGAHEGKSPGEILSDVAKSMVLGFVVGAEAGVCVAQWAIGSIYNDQILIDSANDKWNDIVAPLFNILITDNIVGFMLIGDTVHSLLYVNLFIIDTLKFSGIGFTRTVALFTYVYIQSNLAFANYSHNFPLEGLLLEPMTELSTGEQIPEKTYNVIVDGKQYLSGQDDSDGDLEMDENGTVKLDENGDPKMSSKWKPKYENYKFGAGSVNECGCEIMAIYNMLRFLNMPMKFCDLLYYFEIKNICFGKLGAWPTHLRRFLLEKGIAFDRIYAEDQVKFIEENKSKYKCFIPTYWWSRKLDQVHTTCVIPVKEYLATKKFYHLYYTIMKISKTEKKVDFDYSEKDKYSYIETLNSDVNLVEINGKNKLCADFKNIFYDSYPYHDTKQMSKKEPPFDHKLISMFAIK